MTPHTLQQRIRACWMGKSIGGTLGCPFEGQTGPLDLDFYRPVPTEPLPNDDLDLQIVWLQYLLNSGDREVTPDILAKAWDQHVLFPFDEYGIARRNEAYGIRGIKRGAFDNYFAECMGGAIRSELWACVAPGDPARAAGLAWADASVDHAAEGVYAEMFHAALQSAAFTTDDREALIDIGLRFVPAESRLGRALRDTQKWWLESRDWKSVRGHVLARYGVGNFTDVVANLCFELIGWYAGAGDFGRSICIAVNCGLDTDCTGATLGALLGIIDPDSIPAKWVEPIGEQVVISREIVGISVPPDINHLTELTMQLAKQLADFPAPIGEVLAAGPQRTANEFVSIAARVAHVSGEAVAGKVLPDANWQATTLHGHWSQWRADNFESELLLLKLTLNAPESAGLKLMVGSPSGARAWVDDQLVIAYDEADYRRDPFTALTFHRGGVINHVFKDAQALTVGEHELVVALPRPTSGTVVDLVVGLGDATTNLWHPRGALCAPAVPN